MCPSEGLFLSSTYPRILSLLARLRHANIERCVRPASTQETRNNKLFMHRALAGKDFGLPHPVILAQRDLAAIYCFGVLPESAGFTGVAVRMRTLDLNCL